MLRPVLRLARVSCVLWLALAQLSCADQPRRYYKTPAQAASAVAPTVAPAPSEAELDWASRVGYPPPSAAVSPSLAPLQPATLADRAFESDEQVPVRHLVYRVSFIVPTELRGQRPPLRAPAGELHIDVARERLRARFVGPGWPVDEGTELRLRSDIPGVYLFAGHGGRPLAPGQLAAWFQGQENGRARSTLRVHREVGASGDGPGELVCALLAEWTRQDREEVLPRCAGGSLSPGFRFGPWSAELTAILPLTRSRQKLRADAEDPPLPIRAWPGRAMLEPAELGRLSAARVRTELRATSTEPGVLLVDNATEARAIVVVEGVPVGWAYPHSQVRFAGFTEGDYHVGAVRPFGQPATRATLLHIPGTLRVGKAGLPVRSAK